MPEVLKLSHKTGVRTRSVPPGADLHRTANNAPVWGADHAELRPAHDRVWPPVSAIMRASIAIAVTIGAVLDVVRPSPILGRADEAGFEFRRRHARGGEGRGEGAALRKPESAGRDGSNDGNGSDNTHDLSPSGKKGAARPGP